MRVGMALGRGTGDRLWVYVLDLAHRAATQLRSNVKGGRVLVTASEDIQKLIAELQAALVQSSGRIKELGMRVSELGVELATVFEKGASGELDLKLVKIGGGGTVTDASKLSLKMEPTDTVSAAHLDDELTGALTVIEAAIAAIDTEFELTEANVEITFETTIEGKVSLVLGGKATRERTHVARVTFESDE